MQINHLKPGEQAIIVNYRVNHSSYKHKLLAMGLTPGTALTLLRIAPLGDPIEIQVRGYNLSLRKSEAAILTLKKVSA